ncbi:MULTISPECIES: hypothetical protein [Aurantimicrobium]|jgi:hypothetical protein|uniref:Uncharacterized protein n=1 Tax=Aurantimicrobium minutum TaxID=708131 RepID=A0A173LWG3_9MICO|nr:MULTISPECIES: hypothetical protein [Aurantimicrobium]AXE54438.1 hypothetical protein AURUGA1_00746 [Aurantimicrobium sp. MWH-Uga1]MDH6239484.1 hypothetical protein [Aurantimicrobium minutum]BAU99184.1 Uncharacterized protein AUMI_16420 [Aurantimicrobium minutum]
MNAVEILANTEGHETFPLVLPAIAFGIIAAGFFTFLGLVTYSYKNVAARHRQKWSEASDHGAHH